MGSKATTQRHLYLCLCLKNLPTVTPHYLWDLQVSLPLRPATSMSAWFINRKLFSVACTSRAMEGSRPPVLWHQFWAWDRLSSMARLLCSPWTSGADFHTPQQCFLLQLGASAAGCADRSKRGLVAISTSVLPVRAGPRDYWHCLSGNSQPSIKEKESRQPWRGTRWARWARAVYETGTSMPVPKYNWTNTVVNLGQALKWSTTGVWMKHKEKKALRAANRINQFQQRKWWLMAWPFTTQHSSSLATKSKKKWSSPSLNCWR